jgi:serine/threonine-protein kinase
MYGAYQVVMPLARGGMGGVYLATTATGERVALKVLDSQFADNAELVARLLGEHAIATRASHPGLVEIHESARTAEGVPYLVMENLDAEPLEAIAERGPLPVDTIATIGAQMAAALAALHASGVVHCDVKPDNVVVLDRRLPVGWRKIKVVDFGVSRLIDAPPLPDGAIAGTPWCMAPEQWRGSPCPASDVYALGCTLYLLVTGETPFDGSLPAMMAAHLDRRPPRPSWHAALPDSLERLILRALAKRPADRPTMDEMAAALTALADELAGDATLAIGATLVELRCYG